MAECARLWDRAEGLLAPPGPRTLQQLPDEILVEIFSCLPGTELPPLALVCRRFRQILTTDTIWRRCCKQVLHQYRNILGLWQLVLGPYGGLLNVVVDGLFIIGWMYLPPPYLHIENPMKVKPVFRIHLKEKQSAIVECMYGPKGPHSSQIQLLKKDEFCIECLQTDYHRVSGGQEEVFEAWLQEYMSWTMDDIDDEDLQDSMYMKFFFISDYDKCLIYRRIYHPPSRPDDLMKTGFFKGSYNCHGLEIIMLSFHGSVAKATKITGDPNVPAGQLTLEVALTRPVQLPDQEHLRNMDELSQLIMDIHEQINIEQHLSGSEEAMGVRGEEPVQGSSPPLKSKNRQVDTQGHQQPPKQKAFALPDEITSDADYPSNYRMCFFGTGLVSGQGFNCPQRTPGLFFLFDDDRFGFFWLELKSFSLYSRMRDRFQNSQPPTHEAFDNMLKAMQLWIT